jgi:hypothetical protein
MGSEGMTDDLTFNSIEFDGIKTQTGLNSFSLGYLA